MRAAAGDVRAVGGVGGGEVGLGQETVPRDGAQRVEDGGRQLWVGGGDAVGHAVRSRAASGRSPGTAGAGASCG